MDSISFQKGEMILTSSSNRLPPDFLLLRGGEGEGAARRVTTEAEIAAELAETYVVALNGIASSSMKEANLLPAFALRQGERAG
jgi:hypothetical protein